MRVVLHRPSSGHVVFGVAKKAAIGIFFVLFDSDPRRRIDGRRSFLIVDREHGRAKASLQLRLGFFAQPFELCEASRLAVVRPGLCGGGDHNGRLRNRRRNRRSRNHESGGLVLLRRPVESRAGLQPGGRKGFLAGVLRLRLFAAGRVPHEADDDGGGKNGHAAQHHIGVRRLAGDGLIREPALFLEISSHDRALPIVAAKLTLGAQPPERRFVKKSPSGAWTAWISG